MYKISDEVINFIKKTMKPCRVDIAAGGKSIDEATILRGVLQRDALSPLSFVIMMILLNHILIKSFARYNLSKLKEKINPIIYMDNTKLFAKNEKNNWKPYFSR